LAQRGRGLRLGALAPTGEANVTAKLGGSGDDRVEDHQGRQAEGGCQAQPVKLAAALLRMGGPTPHPTEDDERTARLWPGPSLSSLALEQMSSRTRI
jgi:hypothetical protein